MAEGLANPDGTMTGVAPAAEGEAAFFAAMATPEPDVPPPPAKDPEAPYGRTQDGKPKKGPGGRPPKAAKPSAAERPRVQPAAAGGGKDYSAGLEELFGSVWLGVAPFAPADGGALLLATPALVQSYNALGQHDPRVGRVIDRITAGTVYGACATATLMFGLQLAANHGRVRVDAVRQFGIRDKDDLVNVNNGALQQAAKQAAAQMAQYEQAA